MRQELIEKIVFCLQTQDVEVADIRDRLTIILNDYEVTTRETALTVRNEDKNRYYLRKFLIAKTVSGRTERTIKYYEKVIANILEKINKTADEITTDDIRYYLAIRERRDGVTKTTANNELRCLKSFYMYLQTEEEIEKNPCLKIEQIKTKKVKRPAFTEMEVEKIRAACETTREVAIVEILLSTGCRVTELTQMKINELKQDSIIVHGKGEKDRTVYLNAKAVMALEKYLKERKDTNPYIFCKGIKTVGAPVKKGENQKVLKEWYKYPEKVEKDGHQDKSAIENVVRKIGKRAGVKKVHPHRFRRTCATFALRRGMPIEQVSKMLGHENISTTQIYLDLTEEELQQAHKKYVV